MQGHHLHTPSVVVKSTANNYNGILKELENSLENQRTSFSPDSQDFEEGSVEYSFSEEESGANKETVLNVPYPKMFNGYSSPTTKNSLAIPQKDDLKGIRASTIYTNLSSDSSRMFTSCNDNGSPMMTQKIMQFRPEPEEEFEAVQDRPKKILNDRSVHTSIRKSSLAFPNLMFCNTCNEDTYTSIGFEIRNLGVFGSIKFFFQAIRCCKEANGLSSYQEVVHTCRKCKNVLARVRFS